MTVSEVINAFGGTSETARLFDVLPSAVSNWRAAGKFPDRLHYRISREMAARSMDIDPKLFGVDVPPDSLNAHTAPAGTNGEAA